MLLPFPMRILHCFYQLVRWSKAKEKLSLKVSRFSSSTDNLKTENVATGKLKYLISEQFVHACLVGQISRASFPALGQPGCVQQHKTQGTLLSGRKIVHDNNFWSKCIMKDKNSSDLACGKQQKP